MQIKITKINPTYPDIINKHRNFIESFMSRICNKYKFTFLTMIKNPIGEGYSQPLISSVLSNVSDITVLTQYEGNHIDSSEVYKFCDMFIETINETLQPSFVYIPKYNMYHYGNICHYNTCILMLASMYFFIEFMNKLKSDNIVIQTLRETLIQTYSEIDTNPMAHLNLIKYLNINVHAIEPAEETMVKILSILDGLIPTDLLIHWDFAHSTLKDDADEDLSINEIVDKYVPQYLLVNAQDFNVALDVPCNDQFIPTYSSGKHVYKLVSVILYHAVHFINVFIDANGNYIVKDDMCHRLSDSRFNVGRIGNSQLTEFCYVKLK